MTTPYAIRLLCICLAAFFLLHLAAGLAVSLLAPWAVRTAEGMRPRRAARFLFALRLLPATFAILLVAGLCVPSYLWLEGAGSEEVGITCIAAALLALTACAISVSRSCRAASRSLGYIRYCRMMGRQTCVGTEASPAWVVEGGKPFLVLAGIVRPKLMVSSGVIAALPAEQLAVALRHERAHQVSRDNLKRLLLLLTPDILPFWRGLGVLERSWSRFAEWSADDYAVAGDSRRSLSLAAALVRVARMGACPQTPPLVTSLLADDQDLEQRVDRLLRETPGQFDDRRRPLLAFSGVAAGACLLVGMLQPSTLYSVHSLLEHLTK
jgi:hypothetical protein